MRVVVVILTLMVFVTLVQADHQEAERQKQPQGDGPAFIVDLRATLPTGDATPENAFSLVEDLRQLANLDGFDLSLRMSKQTLPVTSILATFAFDALEDVVEWHGSDSVQSFLESLDLASDKPVQLRIRGTLERQ